jgi:hypothetical protein
MGNIEGTLAMPRKSMNNNFYWASELAKGDGVRVPLRLNHDKTETGIIGYSNLKWDSTVEHLDYDAVITDEKIDKIVAEMIANGQSVKVSLGIDATSVEKICKSGSTECMDAPIDVIFKEMSVLIGENPGIPESSLNISEQITNMICGKQCIELFSTVENYNTSISGNNDDKQVMTLKENEITESEQNDAFNKKVADAVNAQMDLHLKTQEETAKLEKAVAEGVKEAKAKLDAKEAENPFAKKAPCDPKKDDCKQDVKTESVDEAKINAIVEAKVKDATNAITEKYEEFVKKSEVSTGIKSFTEASMDEHVPLMERVLKGESVSIKLDKEEFIKAHSVQGSSIFDEAISTSGTIPHVGTGTGIVILPGGIKVKTIRPWIEVRTIKQGEDKTRFYTLTIPAFGTITEHVSTEITPATHTLTGFDLAADTPRGFRQNVLKAELEKYPADLLEKIRETARVRALEDEVTLVLSTIAAATSADFGANHFDDVGGLVTDETAEDATTALTAAGLEQCKQYLSEQGHQPEGGGAVAAISPRQEKELIQDSTVVRFIQQVQDGSVSRSGKISMYFGLEIFVTNSLASVNNSTRAIVFMKYKAFGFATARDLEIEFDKNINRQSVDIVATHRINAVIKDATAYCILSSKDD